MNKSRVCVTKTINLSKQVPCAKKQNILVYDRNKICDPPCPPIDSHTLTQINKGVAKRIRVCSGAELKRLCQPKQCPCGPIPEKKSRWGLLACLFGLGVKGALAGALVYWTYNIGIWGSSEDTEKLYLDMCNKIGCAKPPDQDCKKGKETVDEKYCKLQTRLTCGTKDTQFVCCSKPGEISVQVHSFGEKWNKLVTTIFEFLAHGPSALSAWLSFFQPGQSTGLPKKVRIPAEPCLRRTPTKESAQ